jgi:copper(I)-binding protein
MRRRAFCTLVTIGLFASACQRSGGEGELSVTDAWVRLPAVAGRPGAGYFKVHGGAAPDRLTAIESPQASRAELHEGGMHDGMMTMRPMDGVDVPAEADIAFAPEANHVMLFGIDPKLRSGGTLPLRLRFASGAERSVDAKLIGAGDPAPAS